MIAIRGFLGPLPQKGKKIHILGSGISGLLLAWHLKEQGFEVNIFSDSGQAGGMIRSEKRPYGLVESAANGILWSEPLDNLCKKLDLKPLKSKPDSAKRYILREGKFRRFPLSFLETVRLFPNLFRSLKVSDQENLEEFGRKAGGFAVYNFVVQAGLYGIYASEAKHLGLKTIFPNIHQQLQSGIPLLDALRAAFPQKTNKTIPQGLHSFPDGMSSLTEALLQSIAKPVQTLELLPMLNEDAHLICCMPACAHLPEFLPDSVKNLLQQVRYAPLISATYFFRKEGTNNIPRGFGMVIPPSEGYSILGILFNDQIFEHRTTSPEYNSFTCIAGGYGRPRLNELSQAELKNTIQKELISILGIKNEPLDFVVNNWNQALPVYSPELPDIWSALDSELHQSEFPISLFGNYTGEISIRGLCNTASSVAKRVGRG